MARNSTSMARNSATIRRKVKDFPYSLKQTNASASQLVVGTDVYLWERTQACSYAFWVFPTSYPSGASTGHIFSEYLTSGTFRGRIIRLDTSGASLKFWLINTFNTNELKVGYTPPPIGRWTRVVITYDGSSTAAGVKCYYNNVLRPQASAVETLTGTIVSSSLSTRWLNWGGGTALGLPCYLGRPAVLNYAMTAQQVADDWYLQEFTGTAPVDLYELTEGSGTTVASSGSGAHNATIGGSAITWDSTITPMKARNAISQNRIALS